MTWDEIINNPLLQNLPFKIETNKFGQILMSPASNKQGIIQFDIGRKMDQKKRTGTIITEFSVETSGGVKVVDVTWASDECMAEYGEVTPSPKAPEISVEVVSPSNSKLEKEHKVELYLAKGALEVRVVNHKKDISFYSHTGKIKNSKLVPKLKI